MRSLEASTLGGLLRELSELYPERPAMVFEGRTWTFRETDQRVDELARGMLALGIEHGDVVSVLAGNRPEWILTAFATTRIGATLAPMNTWYKTAEMAHLLRHAQIKALFMVPNMLKQDYVAMVSEMLPDLASSDVQTIDDTDFPDLRAVVELGEPSLPGVRGVDDVVELGTTLPERAFRDAQASVAATDLAYILYTSGSTAQPKGVRLHHGSIIANDFQIGERQHLTPEDRAWIGIPLFYGLAAVNFLPAAWTHGACVILQEYFDAGKALEIMETERATAYCGLGNMTRALIDHPTRGDRDLSRLQKGLVGLSPEDKRLAIEDLGVSKACSMYGLTESYGNCAVTDADDPLDIKLHTCGKPLPAWDFRVADPETDEELPVGEVGELRIKGHVTSGYHRDDELTSRSFDVHGYFKTGDLVAIHEDGYLRFHSRSKEIMKVGGINVSPYEVEQILREHPHVDQAHVVGIPDEVHGEVICAFVVRSTETLSESDLRSFARDRAASFKAPEFVFFREPEQLPLVASGKVPKHVLRQEAIRVLDRAGDGG